MGEHGLPRTFKLGPYVPDMFLCPWCHEATLLLKPDVAGRSAVCPHCHHTFVSPPDSYVAKRDSVQKYDGKPNV